MESAIRKRNLMLQFKIDSAGYVSKESFVEGIKSIFKIGDDSFNHLILDIFTLVDGKGMFNSKDDRLNKKELDFVINAIPTAEVEEVYLALAETVFNIVNKNGDAVLDINEFREYITKILGSIKTTELREVFKVLSNSTNGIQKDAFMKYCVETISGIQITPKAEVKPTEQE